MKIPEIDDKITVIFGLTILGIATLLTMPDKAASVLHDIVLSLGSIATGYAVAQRKTSKRKSY